MIGDDCEHRAGQRAASQRRPLCALVDRRAHHRARGRGDRRRRLRHGRARGTLGQGAAARRACCIGDDVEIGANTTIDRGALGRHRDRGRRQARQPDPDRAQLPHRRAHRDRGLRRHRRQHEHRAQLQDRRRGDDRRAISRLPTERSSPRRRRRAIRSTAAGRLHRGVAGAAATRMAARRIAAAGDCARCSSGCARSSAAASERRRRDHAAMDINEIMRHLPHRYPFLLVDRVLECEPGQRIKAIKNVTINEPFFPGPLSRVSGHARRADHRGDGAGLGDPRLRHARRCATTRRSLLFFAGIDKARFKRPVVPGRPARCSKSTELNVVRSVFKFSAQASVDRRAGGRSRADGGGARRAGLEQP